MPEIDGRLIQSELGKKSLISNFQIHRAVTSGSQVGRSASDQTVIIGRPFNLETQMEFADIAAFLPKVVCTFIRIYASCLVSNYSFSLALYPCNDVVAL